ncbi:hypothetical protein [Lacimonas salitolerans]|uniref:Uncharacterized protein n=1 Tax=Lacimonas salitolerans TaxID=1323750 RepID=A0ABW4EJZ2_9RHOB
MTDLDHRLLTAHATGDRTALIAWYTEAADTSPDPDAAWFYLTHAYVFALESGAAEAGPLHARLKAAGREE